MFALPILHGEGGRVGEEEGRKEVEKEEGVWGREKEQGGGGEKSREGRRRKEERREEEVGTRKRSGKGERKRAT